MLTTCFLRSSSYFNTDASPRTGALVERLRLTAGSGPRAGRSGTHRTTEEQATVRGAEDSRVGRAFAAAESEHAPVHRSTKESGKHPDRQELPPNLPRVERVLPCSPDQRVCKRCGKETVVIGYEKSSQLDVEPAKYFVLVTKREKRACRSCEELGVVSALLPPQIIEKCLANDRIVIDKHVRPLR